MEEGGRALTQSGDGHEAKGRNCRWIRLSNMILHVHATIATYVFKILHSLFPIHVHGHQAISILLSTPTASINTAYCPPKTEDYN